METRAQPGGRSGKSTKGNTKTLGKITGSPPWGTAGPPGAWFPLSGERGPGVVWALDFSSGGRFYGEAEIETTAAPIMICCMILPPVAPPELPPTGSDSASGARTEGVGTLAPRTSLLLAVHSESSTEMHCKHQHRDQHSELPQQDLCRGPGAGAEEVRPMRWQTLTLRAGR